MALLAIDIGGSGSRAVLRGAETHEASGASLRIVDGRLDVADALDSLSSQLPDLEAELEVVCVGVASLITFGYPQTLAAEVRDRWRCRAVLVTSDAVIAVAGAWGIDGGAVVAAGTGSVGFATDFRQSWVRIDGWGHQLGDSGGGAWIGARGLQAALRTADGRTGGSAALLQKAQKQFGASASLAAAISTAPSPARALASFAPAVAEAADGGDPVADGILSDAARELAATAVAAMTAAPHPRVALVGGLSSIDALARRFAANVVDLIPDAQVVARANAPVHGALALAEAAASGRLTTSHAPYLHLDNQLHPDNRA